MRRLVPRVFTGLRARLVLGFLIVTLISLGLVFATLPRLLDGYFLDQAQQDLNRRTQQVGFFIFLDIYRASSGSAAPRPILEGDPLTAAQAVQDALGTSESGNVLDIAQLLAQANVHVQIATDAANPDQIAYELNVPVGAEVAQPGQQRESLSSTQVYQVNLPDTFWSQDEATAPKRQLIVSLSDPYSYRAQTINQIISVMAVAGVIALIVAVIASVLIADRLSNPIRRLTGAARELSEGHLDTRVPPPSTSREMGELTAAFNSMAERVQASMEYISRDRDRSRDFLADVSHELKTPIAALRTFNELLRDGQVKDRATQREFLDQSRQQIERLDWLAANLLELSKLESGLVLLDLRPDDLRAVVEDAVQQAHTAANRKGVKVVAVLPDEPIRQPHDPQRMGQVLGNLLGNAIKFTPRGGEVRVTLEPTTDGAELRVADTGVGINAAELPFVFERFYRGAQVHESRAAGSGLGLSIVRSIVEMHNGRVSISSTPGKGTEVAVDLPREIAVSSPAPVQA
ncbi:MAG TPA: HAMP domain-containing sensor histidine kinase [Candidatus Limnocylindrales bacterium]